MSWQELLAVSAITFFTCAILSFTISMWFTNLIYRIGVRRDFGRCHSTIWKWVSIRDPYTFCTLPVGHEGKHVDRFRSER